MDEPLKKPKEDFNLEEATRRLEALSPVSLNVLMYIERRKACPVVIKGLKINLLHSAKNLYEAYQAQSAKDGSDFMHVIKASSHEFYIAFNMYLRDIPGSGDDFLESRHTF